MRITSGMSTANMLRSLQGSNERATKLQEQLGSGRRLSCPSDDPVGVSRSLKYSRNLSENDQYTKNVQDAMSFLDATDTALGGVGDILQRVNEIAIYGSNSALPQASKDALAYEVDELLGQLVQVANTTQGGSYIFAGEKVTTMPYALTPTGATTPAGLPPWVTDNGNNGKLNYEIAPGIIDNVNYTGQEVFGRADPLTPNIPATNSIFERVIVLRDQLKTGTFDGVQDVEAALKNDLDQVLNYRSIIGAKVNKMELSSNRLSNANVNITQQIADNDDTDMPKSIMQLKLEENVYRSALGVGARIIPPSLLDFLS